MIATQKQRPGFLVAVAIVAGLTVYASVSAGLVQASAFLPVFVGMCLLERKRTK